MCEKGIASVMGDDLIFIFKCIVLLVKGETYGADAICIFDLLSRYLLVGALQHCCPWLDENTRNTVIIAWERCSGCASLRCDVLGADAMCDVCAMCYSVLHGTDSVCTECVCVELVSMSCQLQWSR